MNYYLVLEDGELFKGAAVGSQMATGAYPEKAGEVVFNTAHSGYEEVATDPSYFHQIVVMTAPMQGNYGSTQSDWESSKMWIHGFVCLQMQNSKRNSGWLQRLIDNKIPVLTEIDTRTLTIKLRSQGTPWGAVVCAETETEAVTRAQKLIVETKKIEGDWVWLASRKEVSIIKGDAPNGPKVAVLDFGAKENILRELKSRCSELRVYPSRTPSEVIEQWNPDALMLTNGPGDPSQVKVAVETTKHFLGKKPIFGICLGHQAIGQVFGANVVKAKNMMHGKTSLIKVVKDTKIFDGLPKEFTQTRYHSLIVEKENLPEDIIVTSYSEDDNEIMSLEIKDKQIYGVQFHPESIMSEHGYKIINNFLKL